MKKTILIVEDDSSIASLLDSSFKGKGYNTKICVTGKETEEFLKNKESIANLALIILDRMLPDMDAIKLLDTLPKVDGITLPVIILSSLNTSKDVMKGIQMGAIDYITKPFNHNILIEKAMRLLQEKKAA